MSYSIIDYKQGRKRANSTTDEGSSPSAIGTGNMQYMGIPDERNEILEIEFQTSQSSVTYLGSNVKAKIPTTNPAKGTLSFKPVNGISFYDMLGRKHYNNIDDHADVIDSIDGNEITLTTGLIGTTDYVNMICYNSTKDEYYYIVSHTTDVLTVDDISNAEADDVVTLITGMMIEPFTNSEGKKPRINFCSTNAYVDSAYKSIELYACETTSLVYEYNQNGYINTRQEIMAKNWAFTESNPTLSYAGDEDQSFSVFDSLRYESSTADMPAGSDANLDVIGCNLALAHMVTGTVRDKRILEFNYGREGIDAMLSAMIIGYREDLEANVNVVESGKVTWIMRKQDTSKYIIIRLTNAYPIFSKVMLEHGEPLGMSVSFLANGIWVFIKDDVAESDY